MTLWVPRSADPLLEARARADAERKELAEDRMHDLLQTTRRMNDELKRIDPYLELVWVSARASDEDPVVIPGRWHVVRHNPGAPDTWMPVVGADGEYVEPTSRIFDKLAEGNMWNEDYGHRARKRQARAAAEKEREKETRRAQLADEVRERWAAATQTRISFSPDHRWTQNAAGRRGARQ